MDQTRVRFAPSPTGNVHIGNIRAAIFNWLFARHTKGKFLLRIEDTDIERSTPEAIQNLLAAMKWLNLDYDEEVVYQTQQLQTHMEAAQKLIKNGDAYLTFDKNGEKGPTYFRIPWDPERCPFVRKVGEVTLQLHAETPFEISDHGIHYAQLSRKGKPMEENASIGGFRNLKLYDLNDHEIFSIEDHFSEIQNGKSFAIENAVKAVFTRYEIFYTDLVKGELAKPLDSMRDFVIIRSDNTPIFHLSNVIDDITQNITHIIRGDDHVENTYRHLFIFYCVGATPPAYAHLPMIVNHEGKPYSKRDGDAFVGDFKTKGYLPDALFNYLTLLGWSPGDNREKMTRTELIEAFSLDRVNASPAQLDHIKLQNMNALYLAELPEQEVIQQFWEVAHPLLNLEQNQFNYFVQVAQLMISRTRYGAQTVDWQYFFNENYPMDEKSLKKALETPNMQNALKTLLEKIEEATVITEEELINSIHFAESANNLQEGKLNQPLRLIITGVRGGADLIQTLLLIGRDQIIARLHHRLN